MKLLRWFLASTLGLLTVGVVRVFFSRYTVLLLDNEDLIDEEEAVEGDSMDLRGTPTHECICGSKVWKIKALFEDYEIATYFLDMECADCGSLATAPTPLDREGMEY